MAFVLHQGPKIVEWPVSVFVPIDGGEVEEHVCHASFEILPQSEFDKLLNLGDAALLGRVVVGFADDVTFEDGSPVPFTDQNKANLFAIPYVRVGFAQAYQQAASGIERKNLSLRAGSTRSDRKRRKKR